MIKIKVPVSFFPEREYVIRILFEEFLGLTVTIETDLKTPAYNILLPNCSTLIIEDHFFGENKEESYLAKEKLPSSYILKKNAQFAPEDDMLILFGNEKLEYSPEQRTIICGNDIFAASFFLLTRWEECVTDKKDSHGRFPDEESFLFKNKLHHRPLVNEYVEFIWNTLNFLGFNGERKKREFQFFPTHDVDHIARYDTGGKFLRALAGDLFLRKNPVYIPFTIRDFVFSNLKLRKDNYDTFDFLMDSSEKLNLKSNFYFIGLNSDDSTATYDINQARTRNIIDRIQRRGHRIGIHGSYNSFDNEQQFRAELLRLREYNPDLAEGRQHYFRFKVPDTWQMWDNCGLTSDSSLGYSKDAGFRCGVCYEYSAFNVRTRKMLKLEEKPLILMEISLMGNRVPEEILLSTAKKLIQKVKKYNGTFVFLWHNNTFNYPNFRGGFKLYSQIIQMI